MGVLYSLQEAICAFKDFLRECRQHLNRFFDTKIYVLYGNVKAFCLACRRLRFVFLSVPAKTFLQTVNLHTSIVGTIFIIVVSGSLFAVRRYLFAPCAVLCSQAAYRDSSGAENMFTVCHPRFYSTGYKEFFPVVAVARFKVPRRGVVSFCLFS